MNGELKPAFHDWLQEQSYREDKVGRLAQFVQNNEYFNDPQPLNTLQWYQRILTVDQAPTNQIVALHCAWNEWKSHAVLQDKAELISKLNAAYCALLTTRKRAYGRDHSVNEEIERLLNRLEGHKTRRQRRCECSEVPTQSADEAVIEAFELVKEKLSHYSTIRHNADIYIKNRQRRLAEST